DRRDAPAADRAPGAVAGSVALLGVLPAAADVGCGSGADAPYRRTASGAAVRRQPNAARSVASGRLRCWAQARGDADAQDGHRGAVSKAQDQSATSGAPGVPDWSWAFDTARSEEH